MSQYNYCKINTPMSTINKRRELNLCSDWIYFLFWVCCIVAYALSANLVKRAEYAIWQQDAAWCQCNLTGCWRADKAKRALVRKPPSPWGFITVKAEMKQSAKTDTQWRLSFPLPRSGSCVSAVTVMAPCRVLSSHSLLSTHSLSGSCVSVRQIDR